MGGGVLSPKTPPSATPLMFKMTIDCSTKYWKNSIKTDGIVLSFGIIIFLHKSSL